MSGETFTITIARPLESPNRTRGYHWRTRHRESQAWEQEIASAFPTSGTRLGRISLELRTEPYQDRRGRWKQRTIRRRERRGVFVHRFVKSAHRLIHDPDNLAYATKPLLDALKRLSLIYDDSAAWLDQTETRQTISLTGVEFTAITLTISARSEA